MRSVIYGFIGAMAVSLVVGCEPVSEPWVSGKQAERLESERTRTDDQRDALRARLRNYGGAYQ